MTAPMSRLYNGFVFMPGVGVAFDYIRKTKSGRSLGRIGVVVEDHNHLGTVTIRELVDGHEQYRQFYKAAMFNVVLNTD